MNNVNTLCTVSPDDAKKLRHSAGTDEGPVRSAPQPSNVGENMDVLSGVICLVGLDSNEECFVSVHATLLSLGATISPSFGEHLTHFITMQPSLEDTDKLNKRILAAELLDIFVVSVEWLEQCKSTNQKANELDFRITSSLSAVVRATKQGLIQNQSTTSLHVDQQNCHRLSGDANNPSRFSRASSHHSIANIEELERVIYDDTDTMLSTINNPSTATADKSAPSVPMPTFREYIPPVVPQRVLETVAKRRRSERISDLVSDTESETESKEEEDDVSKRQKMESWEYVQSISIDSMLPIVFLPGREGDKLPPFVFHKGANAYSTTKNGGSGIQGLGVNGKKTSSDNGNAYSSSSSKNKSGTNAKDTTSSKTKDSKDTVAVPKNKLVIAYTGFDDKHGERSTLVQTLRQLIKTIKRRVADGDVVITPIIDNTTTGCSGEANDAMEVDQSDGEENITSSNKGNPSSTSLNRLEGGALSPDSKKKRGRPRGGSTTSRDSNNNNNNNSSNEKNQAVDVTVSSADKRVRGRSRNSSAADIQDHMSSTHDTTVAITSTSPLKKKHTTTTTTESSCIVPEEMLQITGWQIEALECSVSILSNQSDFSAASCTHVIVNANSSARTLRRLFAMARGVCLVTQEWVTSSVSSQSWANVGHYLHPSCAAMFRNMRDELGMIIKDRIPRADVFRSIKVCVVDSTNPPLETLTDLVQAAGAVICYQIGERNVQLTVFGDASAAYDWTVRMAKKRRPWSNKAVADVKALAENGKCVTAKFVFNCIGEGKLRAPIQGDGELISLDNLLGNVTSDPPQKSNSAKNAAQSDAATMENDNEYYFLDNTATTSINTSTRRSRHSLGAESETVVDLTEDHPAPGLSSSGKKLTPAEERLQRQLSNEFLPNQYTKGKNNKKNTDVVGDSSAATDANSVSTKRSSTTAPNTTTNMTSSTTATAAPKSAIASLLGSWIEVRFYGYGMRRSKALTAGLPAVGEDINYSPMYTNHKLISKSAPSTVRKHDNTSVTTKDDIKAGNDSTSDAIMEKSTAASASAILPSVSTTINNSDAADRHGTSSAITHVDNNTDVVTTSNPTSGPTNAAPSNTVNATSTIASPIASPNTSPLTRSNTLCDDVPPFSYPDDTGTDTGTAQSSAAPTPLRTKSTLSNNNNTGSGDKDSSIQAYPSNTQLVVDSLLELSRTSRKNDKPAQKSAIISSKGNSTGAAATVTTPASTTTAVLGHNPDVSVHDSATFSRIQAVAANKPSTSATAITTMKASKIRSSSTSSDGRRGSVFTITVPYQPAPIASTTAPTAIPTTSVAQESVKDVTVDTMDIDESTTGSTAAVEKTTSKSDAINEKVSAEEVCTLENQSSVQKQQMVSPGSKSVDTMKGDAATVSIPVPVRSPVAIKKTAPQSAAATCGDTTSTSAPTEAGVALDCVPLFVTVPDVPVPDVPVPDVPVPVPIPVPASIPVSVPVPVSVPIPARHPLQASLSPAATSHSYSHNNSNSKEPELSSKSSNTSSDKDTSGKKVDFKDHVQSAFSGKCESDKIVAGSSTSEAGKSIIVQTKSAESKQIHGSLSVKNSVGNERRVSYSMSLVAPDTVTDNKNSNVGASPSAKASTSTTGAAPSSNPSVQLIVSTTSGASGGTPGRSAPYVPIKITTNSSTAGGAATISTNRGLATSQRFSLPTRLSDTNPLKRKSQFVDPYQSYDTGSNKLNKGSAGNILYAHTNTNSIYNASSTPQLSHGAYNTNIVKPIAKNRNNSILEDDIQTDDSSQEKRKNDQASLRGRVGGTAPFRSSYPPAASYNSSSNNSVSGHNRNSPASSTNTINPISSYHNTNTASYSTSNRNSLPSSSTSSRDYNRPTPVNTSYNYHTTNSNNNHNQSTNSSVVTSSHHAGTPQAQPQQYRTNSNIYMRRSPLLSPSPNAHSTSSANHTPNSAYTANTSKKSNLHAPRLSSSNLAALTSHTSVGPAAKGLLIKKGKPVRSTTENSALNSANLAILGSRTTNPLNDAASDAESEQLIFTPASQNAGVAVNKG